MAAASTLEPLRLALAQVDGGRHDSEPEAERGLLCKVLCNLAKALWGTDDVQSRFLAFGLAMAAVIVDENADPFERDAEHPRKVRRVALTCAQGALRPNFGRIVDAWDNDWLRGAQCTALLQQLVLSYNWRADSSRQAALNPSARASSDEMLVTPGFTKTKIALMCKEEGDSLFRNGQKDEAVMPYYVALHYLRGAAAVLCDLSRAYAKRTESAGGPHHLAAVRTAVAAYLLNPSEADTRTYLESLPSIKRVVTERDLYELEHAGAAPGSAMVKKYEECLQASQKGKPGIEAEFDDRFHSFAEELAWCRPSGLADAELKQLAKEMQAHCSLKIHEDRYFTRSEAVDFPDHYRDKRFRGPPDEETMRLWQDKSVKYQAGSCHVAVGFVDLSPLIMGELVGESDEPLRWVGCEASAHSVAKALVLTEMLRAGASSCDVALVSYSLVWTQSGLAAFCAAVDQALAMDWALESSPDVATYLEHWRDQTAPSAEEAHREWFGDDFARRKLSASGSPITAMKRLVDRQALFRYLVSGDLASAAESEEPLVGNVMMFRSPPETPPRQLFESVFSCFEDAVLPYHAQRIRSVPDTNVVDSLLSLLEARFDRLSSWMQDSRIQIEVHHNLISLTDTPTLKEVRALQPSSMSWSNVVDYIDWADFHRLAEQCSTPHTVHHAYSMNWPLLIKGAVIIDYQNAETRKKCLRRGRKLICRAVREQGTEALVLLPLTTSPINVASLACAEQLYTKWVEHFVGASGGLLRRGVDDAAPAAGGDSTASANLTASLGRFPVMGSQGAVCIRLEFCYRSDL